MGHRGSAHYVCSGTQGICHSVHLLFAWWSGSIAGPNERLPQLREIWRHHVAGRQRCSAPASENQRTLGVDPSAHDALGAHIWISYSPDLRHWGNHKLMLEARRGAWWDANKIGMSPPPIETSRGWLMIYH